MAVELQQVSYNQKEIFKYQLADLLKEVVSDGASIGFVLPLSGRAAIEFWEQTVFPELKTGSRLLWIAKCDEKVVGTVQLIVSMPANQTHRCEVAKLFVSTAYRGLGIGKSLMAEVLSSATKMDKTLITLDTRTGDISQSLYESLGFSLAGTIPHYALDPDRLNFASTSYMYKQLEPLTEGNE